MQLELYQEVVLTCDFPKYNLRSGDLVTLVDYAPHPQGGEDGYVLEIFNALGDSIDVVAVPQSAVTPLRSDLILSTRPLS